MNLIQINATTIPDAWYQLGYNLMRHGRKFRIDKGSFEGQYRLEFDYVTVNIKYPGTRPLIPEISPLLQIPNPTTSEYVEKEYMLYLLSEDKKDNEEYTYGERINSKLLIKDKILPSQLEEVIRKFKEEGYRTNQCVIEIAEPKDIHSSDPPCLRLIQFRIQDNKLHIFVYFRSNDLWAGFPVNIAGIQILKEFIKDSISDSLEDGEIIYSSMGLHVYDYTFDYLKKITYQV